MARSGQGGRGLWRILFVDLAPSPGGSVVSLAHLLSGLDRDRFVPVVVLSIHNPGVALFEPLGVEVVRLPGYRQGTPEFAPPVQRLRTGRVGRWVRRQGALLHAWRAGGLALRLAGRVLPEAWRIARAVRATRADLIHLNNIVSLNRAGILAARWTGRPCLCHIRGLNPLEPVDRWLVRWVDRFIFISEAVQRSQEAAGIPLAGEVVYNAVDLRAFQPPVDPERLRQEFGFPPGARVFGMVGRLEPWKGHQVFLQALASLRQRHPEACGLIVGEAETNSPAYPGELQALADSLGLGKVVAFAGYRPDALRLMTGMEAVVHCSVEPEPFGRVLIEGMAAGRPVIGSAAGAVSEIIEDGVNGLLTPPGDAEALAQAMARILEEPAAARAWAEAGHQTVLARFTLERHVAAIQRIYEEILGSAAERD